MIGSLQKQVGTSPTVQDRGKGYRQNKTIDKPYDDSKYNVNDKIFPSKFASVAESAVANECNPALQNASLILRNDLTAISTGRWKSTDFSFSRFLNRSSPLVFVIKLQTAKWRSTIAGVRITRRIQGVNF